MTVKVTKAQIQSEVRRVFAADSFLYERRVHDRLWVVSVHIERLCRLEDHAPTRQAARRAIHALLTRLAPVKP